MTPTKDDLEKKICRGCLCLPCECEAAEAYALAFGVKEYGYSCTMQEGI